MSRHGRQVRLAEVGLSGQARIGRARVGVPFGGLAGEVAARYLAGAGVGLVRVCEARLAEVVAAVDARVQVEVDAGLAGGEPEADFGLTNRAARSVAAGAHFALNALRAALRADP